MKPAIGIFKRSLTSIAIAVTVKAGMMRSAREFELGLRIGLVGYEVRARLLQGRLSLRSARGDAVLPVTCRYMVSTTCAVMSIHDVALAGRRIII